MKKLAWLVFFVCAYSIAEPHLAAGLHHFCVSDDDGVKCWRDVDYPAERWFTFSQAWEPCSDQYDGPPMTCEEFFRSVTTPPAFSAEIDELWAEDNETCARHGETTSCWPTANVDIGTPDPYRDRKDFVECWSNQNRDGVICDTREGKQTIHFERQPASIRQVVVVTHKVCVRDEKGVMCAPFPEHARWLRGPQAIPYLSDMRELAAATFLVCGINGLQIRCWDTKSNRPHEPGVQLKVGRKLFHVDSFGEGLRWMAYHSYRATSAVLTAAQEIYEKSAALSPETRAPVRLFLMNAPLPLAESDSAEFFQVQAVPAYREGLAKVNGEAGISGLSGIPASPPVLRANLALIAAVLRSHPAFTAAEPGITAALAEVGKALAGPDSELAVRGGEICHSLKSMPVLSRHPWLRFLLVKLTNLPPAA